MPLELEFFEDEPVVTERKLPKLKDETILDTVKNLPVNDPKDPRQKARFVIELAGEWKPIGASKNADGTPIPDDERATDDAKVIELRKDLDTAANMLEVPVTVRKKVLYGTISGTGKNKGFTEHSSDHTHAKFIVYAVPKQLKNKSKVEETPADETDESNAHSRTR